MPFKSKAQRRKFAQLLVEGKITGRDLRGVEPLDRRQGAARTRRLQARGSEAAHHEASSEKARDDEARDQERPTEELDPAKAARKATRAPQLDGRPRSRRGRRSSCNRPSQQRRNMARRSRRGVNHGARDAHSSRDVDADRRQARRHRRRQRHRRGDGDGCLLPWPPRAERRPARGPGCDARRRARRQGRAAGSGEELGRPGRHGEGRDGSVRGGHRPEARPRDAAVAGHVRALRLRRGDGRQLHARVRAGARPAARLRHGLRQPGVGGGRRRRGPGGGAVEEAG